MWWNVIIFKMAITICLLVMGWIPEIVPVDAPMIEVNHGKCSTFQANTVYLYRWILPVEQ